jgi:hypothetical protein
MSAVTNNSLAGFLAVYAQKSLAAFVADMPPASLFMEDFSDTIASAGTSVTTRIPTSNFSTLNDLANGWESQAASASAVTMTLKTLGHDQPFNVTEWATVSETMILNTYLPVLAKQVANGVLVTALNNVTSSTYTNVVTVQNSTGSFNVTGAISLQSCSVALTNQEIPQQDRYAIVTPSMFASLTNGVLPTYIYGSPEVVRNYGNGTSEARRPFHVIDADVYQYPRFTGAALPYGGDKYSNSDKLVGIYGQKQGLAIAMRSPITINNGLYQSYTATDPTSGVSIQTVIVFDLSKPVIRLGTYVLFGTAAANPKAIIPIVTSTT